MKGIKNTKTKMLKGRRDLRGINKTALTARNNEGKIKPRETRPTTETNF